MNMEQLFSIQKQLDQRIVENHNLHNKDLVPAKILALEVELGELANETRCFKFWSTKAPSDKSVILEEYVDCLHFLMSIGLDQGFSDREFPMRDSTEELVQQFQEVFKRSSDFHAILNQENYVALFESFLTLGKKLGFTWQEIESAYLLKNEINHQRQDEGY